MILDDDIIESSLGRVCVHWQRAGLAQTGVQGLVHNHFKVSKIDFLRDPGVQDFELDLMKFMALLNGEIMKRNTKGGFEVIIQTCLNFKIKEELAGRFW